MECIKCGTPINTNINTTLTDGKLIICNDCAANLMDKKIKISNIANKEYLHCVVNCNICKEDRIVKYSSMRVKYIFDNTYFSNNICHPCSRKLPKKMPKTKSIAKNKSYIFKNCEIFESNLSRCNLSFRCIHYDTCLNNAVLKHWEGWNCNFINKKGEIILNNTEEINSTNFKDKRIDKILKSYGFYNSNERASEYISIFNKNAETSSIDNYGLKEMSKVYKLR